MNYENASVFTKLRQAFPSGIQSDVDAVLLRIPHADVYTAHNIDVSIALEHVHIPGSLILKDFADREELTIEERPRIILACLLTRHHDGHVREKYVHHIARIAELWVAPYVLVLVGQRVGPILKAILPHLEFMNRCVYREFAAENREFIQRIRQQTMSH